MMLLCYNNCNFFLRGTVMEKRKDYISWDEYFMGVAILAAQ
jgi:hypothetical protein